MAIDPTLIAKMPDGPVKDALKEADAAIDASGGGGGGGVALLQQPDAQLTGGSLRYYMGSFGATTESEGTWTPARAGSITGIAVRVNDNSLSGASTFTVRINGAPTAITVTVPAGTNGEFSFTGSVAVAVGDRITVEYAIGGGGFESVNVSSVYEYASS